MKLFKNIIIYLLLFLPYFILFLPEIKFNNCTYFICPLIAFLFLFRPLICILRLLANNRIDRFEIWQNFTPFRVDRYWWFVFFNQDTRESNHKI